VDHFFDELNQVSTSWEPYRPWASALARYCLGREDTGPVPGWGPDPDERCPPQATTSPATEPGPRRSRTKAMTRSLTARKRMLTEIAQQLIDAAFALGVAAGRSEITGTYARQLVQEAITGTA
jgi:hypothetical protein